MLSISTVAHASFLKGEAYLILGISRIFPCLLSQSLCPVKNKTKTKFTISWIIHPIWLDLTFNLSEDRGETSFLEQVTIIGYQT